MRVALPLILLACPMALPAQIAPGPQSATPPGPAGITIRPDPSNRELQESRERIREGRRSGGLTKKEARQLRKEATVNDALAKHYARDGLSDSEQRELDMRGRALQSLTEAQRSQPPRH